MRIVLDALAAGKHVYCETPLTWSIDEGKSVIEAQKKTGKLVMAGRQGKTSAGIQKAKELIRDGALGKVPLVRMVNHCNSADGAWVYPIPASAVRRRSRKIRSGSSGGAAGGNIRAESLPICGCTGSLRCTR